MPNDIDFQRPDFCIDMYFAVCLVLYSHCAYCWGLPEEDWKFPHNKAWYL